MKIINVHTHVSKKCRKENINGLIEDMEISGISKSFILPTFDDGYDYSLEELINISKNNKNDGKLEVLYCPNLNEKNIKMQVKKARSLFENRLIKGVKILLGYQRIMPEDKKLIPFYNLCERFDLPVMFHTGDPSESDAKLIYCRPIDIDSLSVDRPNLKIIMAHLGNPWLDEASEVIYKNPNVYGDISGFFLDFNDKRYVKFMRKKINDFISYASGSKLLFGTDFPLVGSLNYLRFVRSLDLNDEELKLLFYRNAENLFKLK